MYTVIFLSSLILCSWCVTMAVADLYQWTDANGVLHIVDEAVEVPDQYREQLTVFSAPEAKDSAKSNQLPLAPSRTYAKHSQGAFAQKLARDLGLIKNDNEDGLGPLNGAGIRPAGSWKVSEPLSPEAFGEVMTAVERAAMSQRITLSADKARAAVEKMAETHLPPRQIVQPPPADPEVIVLEQPPQIIEVVHQPHYVPVPYAVGSSRFPHRRRMRNHHRDRRRDGLPGGDGVVVEPRRGPRDQDPNKPLRPSLARTPLGTSRLPMGASRLPVGAKAPTGRSIR